MSSRDLIHWNRMSAPEPFLDHGVLGKDWDTGILFMGCAPPVASDGQQWFYYTGSKMDHGPRGKADSYKRRMGLVWLPIDRFASIQPDDHGQDATLTTVPLKLEGKAIHINAEAGQGTVALELLDARGDVISGFSQEDCQHLRRKDSLDHTIAWKSTRPLPAGETQIRFILRDARLYSFWVE